MAQIGMTDEVRELRARMKNFIDDEVIEAEPELERLAEDDLHSVTGLPVELYRAAEDAASTRRTACPAPVTRRAAAPPGQVADLQAEAKARGLWALGHPAEIGGGGLPFIDYVYVNEVIGRSEYGQSPSARHAAGLDHAAPVRRDEQRERYLAPLVAGEVSRASP